MRWKKLKRVQESRVYELSRRRLIENQNTLHELTARIQELQNEVTCMSDSRNFKVIESVRNRLSHVPSQPVFFPPHPDPGGMLSRSPRTPSRKNGPPSYGKSENVFANPTASSFAPCPQESNPWISNVSEHTSPYVMSEHQLRIRNASQDRQPEIHLTPRRKVFKGFMVRPTKTSDLGTSLWQIPNTNIRFKTEVCTCSQFLRKRLQWIKEVELVDSVDELKIFVIYLRNSWTKLWVPRRENCFSTEQNHPEYPLEEKGQSGGDESSKRRRVPSRKTDRLPDLRTLPGHWEPMIPSRTMPTCSLLVFEITIFRNSIRSATKLSYRWHKSPLMTSWKAWTN